MKRNETVLVYGATALLLVILGIAVLFGNDGSPRDASAQNASALGSEQRRPTSFDELLLGKPEVADAGKKDEAQRPGPGAAEVPVTVPPVASSGPMQTVPLDRREAVRAAGISVLGESQRDGNFRVVAVKPGDDLASLVARWCGSPQRETLDLVRSLNETVEGNRITPGQKLVLPWVEDSVLLDKHIARLEEEDARRLAAANPKAESAGEVRTPAPAGKAAQPYVVKEKESLWAIAARQVEKKKVPAYIEQILAANPGLLPDKLKVGQKITLP